MIRENSVRLATRPAAHLPSVSWFVRAAVATAMTGAIVVPALAATDDALEEVTVTGSRIVRRDLTAPSPIVTVGTESFEKSSTTSIESVLNQMPQFVPGGSQFASGGLVSGPTATPGAATVNLRGLGTNRTLVLLDGRRAQPANASLIVDLNSIPQAALQGVEVITGGASAVYGPDAIAGVVNFTLKKNFEGLDLDAQTGITQQGDGQDTHVSALMGMNSGNGRGNIMVGLDWAKRSAVYARDRDFYVNGWRDPQNASGGFNLPPTYIGDFGNYPAQTAISQVLGIPLAGGTTAVPNSSEFRFNSDGSVFVNQGGFGYNGPLGQLDAGRDTMMVRLANGTLDQKSTVGVISSPADRRSMFLRGRYEITDSLNGFLQANYTNSQVEARGGGYAPAILLWGASIPRDGRALPAELQTLLDSRPNPNANWTLYQVLDYYGILSADNKTNIHQLMAGLDGKLPVKDWTWEAYYASGVTDTVSETPVPSLQRYQQLVAAPNFGRNAALPSSVFGYTLNCTTGLPVFDQFTPSQNCLTGIETRRRQVTSLTQDVFEANVQGGAFNAPAGEVRFAAGVAWRKNDFKFDPGNPAEQINDTPVGLFASAGTKGRTAVKEVYGELLAPVVHNVNLELGYRLSDFDTAGSHGTYKALFTWKALDSLTLRGGYQVATRAPNVAELFGGDRLDVVSFPSVDPCSAVTLSSWGNVASNPNRTKVQALCRALIGNSTSAFDTNTYNASTPGVNATGPNGFTRQSPPFFPLEIEIERGNPNVGPETGRTWTLGAVISEPFGWQDLVVTLDGYRIRMSDTISRLSSVTVYNNCFNFDGASNPGYDVNNSYCKLILRNPLTGDREQVYAVFANLGKLATSGADLTVSYKHDLGPGNAYVNSALSWLNKYEYQPSLDAPVTDATGTLDRGGLFDYRLVTNVGYRLGALNLGLGWRFLPSVDDSTKALQPTTKVQGVGAYSVFNLNASYDFGRTTVRAGIDNLLDKGPPVVGANPGAPGGGDTNSDQTNASYYDVLGRRFYVGLKASF
jgi:outer membrane receptor protein involved in Fe transport